DDLTDGILNDSDITFGGDLTGSDQSQTVIKINGATVPAAGTLTAGHLLQVSGNSSLTYNYIVNANVATNAAIDGTKISPNFGNQTIQTTGTLQSGTSTINSVTTPTPPANGGIVYVDSDDGRPYFVDPLGAVIPMFDSSAGLPGDGYEVLASNGV